MHYKQLIKVLPLLLAGSAVASDDSFKKPGPEIIISVPSGENLIISNDKKDENNPFVNHLVIPTTADGRVSEETGLQMRLLNGSWADGKLNTFQVIVQIKPEGKALATSLQVICTVKGKYLPGKNRPHHAEFTIENSRNYLEPCGDPDKTGYRIECGSDDAKVQGWNPRAACAGGHILPTNRLQPPIPLDARLLPRAIPSRA